MNHSLEIMQVSCAADVNVQGDFMVFELCRYILPIKHFKAINVLQCQTILKCLTMPG